MNDKRPLAIPRTKSGQVTMFVIIGLVLLLVVALSMMFLAPSVPEQAGRIDSQQVITFVERCLESTAEDALITAGTQGGFTRLGGRTFNENQPWKGDAFASGPQRVPYWYFLADCERDNGCITFAPPPLCAVGECVLDGQYPGAGLSIQEEVERDIQENLHECLNDFTSLDETFTVEAGAPRAKVVFTERDVDVRLTLPLDLRDEETNEYIALDQFSTRLDIDFEELYRLARDVIQLEYETQFIEENFLHFLSIYQGDAPLLPPFNDAEFFGGQKIWMRTDVEHQLETEILPYLSFIQIVNAYEGYHPLAVTEDIEPDYQDYVRGLFAYSEIIIPATSDSDKIYPDLGVSFLYPYANIYLNINDEEVLKGKNLGGGNFFMKIAGIFMKQYEHKYDVSWPMIVTIEEPAALSGKGYAFSFGIEANIVNNFPMTATRDIVTVDQRGPATVDIGEPQHHAAGDYTLTVTDRRTGAPIRDAIITYECGWSYQTPVMTDSTGKWTGTLPYCAVGGNIRAHIPLLYHQEETAYNSVGSGGTGTLELWPFVQKEVVLYKLPVTQLKLTCTDPASCRESLSWNEPITYNLSLDDTGATTDAVCATCTTQTVNSTQDQYGMVMISRIPLSSDLPVPLQGTLAFGKQGENIDFNQGEDLTTYLDQFEISPEEEAAIRAELAASSDFPQELVDSTSIKELLSAQATESIAFQAALQDSYIIEIIPGDYAIEGLLFFDGNLSIPSEKRKEGGIFGKSYVLPAVELPSWLQGGVSLKDPLVTFSEEDVYSSKKLVIYLLEEELPTTWTELEEFKSVEESQKPYMTRVLPRFED